MAVRLPTRTSVGEKAGDCHDAPVRARAGGRRVALRLGFATVIVSGMGGLGSCSVEPPEPTTYAGALFAGTNAARVDHGLDVLTASECAADAARVRARALLGEEALEHAPLDAVIEECAPATMAAENLSRADAPADQVVEAWLESPGHRANILDPALTELGVACVEDGTQMLCSQVFLGP